MEISLTGFVQKLSEKVSCDVIQGKEFMDENTIKMVRLNYIGPEAAGFYDRLREGQVQVVDSAASGFINSSEDSRNNIHELFSRNIPCIFYTENSVPGEEETVLAEANRITLLKVHSEPENFTKIAEGELEKLLSPTMDFRGTMVEVYGVGVMITGRSNVGKSECAIDLLQRGHRLIGDDIVEVAKRGGQVLIARGKYPISHRMELRGVGIIDVIKLLGISSVKEMQKIELIVALERWDPDKSYERLGIEERCREILGIEIPCVEIPVAPGRNTAILVEIAAMNHRLRRRGIIPGRELELQVIESMKRADDQT